MKHFVFRSDKVYRKHQGTAHPYTTTTVWQVKRNRLVFLGRMTDTYVDDRQLVRPILQAAKALPAGLLCNPEKFSLLSLEADGHASFQQV